MSSLTISQLKEELKKRKVTFEEGKLKKYYLDLYSGSSKGRTSAANLSEDEGDRSSSPKARRSITRTQVPSTPPKKAVSSDEELDDKTLRAELTKRGHSPGPITASTRDVYERMLRDSLKGEASGTPRKAASSAPGTPAKVATPKRGRAAKALLLSDDDEAETETDGPSKSPTRRSRSSSVRRRSEIDRLKIDHPGPKVVEAVPFTEAGPNTRSRRQPDSDNSQGSYTTVSKPAPRAACTTQACQQKQGVIMLVLLIALGVAVYFALKYGITMPIRK